MDQVIFFKISVNISSSAKKELPRYFIKKRILQLHWKLLMGFECHQIERKPIAKEFWLDAFPKIPILSISSALGTTMLFNNLAQSKQKLGWIKNKLGAYDIISLQGLTHIVRRPLKEAFPASKIVILD